MRSLKRLIVSAYCVYLNVSLPRSNLYTHIGVLWVSQVGFEGWVINRHIAKAKSDSYQRYLPRGRFKTIHCYRQNAHYNQSGIIQAIGAQPPPNHVAGMIQL
jgi:hypothetical protein